MILNNFTNLQKNYTFLCLTEQNGSATSIASTYPIKDVNGNIHTRFSTDHSSYPNYVPFIGNRISVVSNHSNSSPSFYTCLMIGNGTTPATPDDYCMESVISDGFSYSGNIMRTILFDVEKEKVMKNYIITLSVTNTSATDLTISEIGLIHCVREESNTGYNTLLHREVFEPVTIPVNESRRFILDLEVVKQIA